MFRFYKVLKISFLVLIACNIGQSKQVKPEKVYRIVYEIKSNEWYKQQAELWKLELDKDPKNPEAWYNYYNANRYAHFEDIDSQDKKNQLNKIIEDMEKAIPGTYVYYLLKYWNNWDIHDISLIEKAFQLEPEKPDTYYPLILHYELYQQQDKMQEFCLKLYDSRDIAPWLINYNYNVLMSLEENAILITNGDNDTYPVWMLQNAFNIRKDVIVLNISLTPTPSYLERKFENSDISIDYTALRKNAKDKGDSDSQNTFKSNYIQDLCLMIAEKYPHIPIYFALTVYGEYIERIREDLYIVGLAYQYAEERLDNIALIKKNLEKKFRLDYLLYDWYHEQYPGTTLRNKIHLNYVIPMIMLGDHYAKSGDDYQAERWHSLALRLAEQAKDQKAIIEIKNKVQEYHNE